jgi:hypothetical protein
MNDLLFITIVFCLIASMGSCTAKQVIEARAEYIKLEQLKAGIEENESSQHIR